MNGDQPLTGRAGDPAPPKVYITRVFNFGTWEEWRNMKVDFSEDVIEDAVKNPLRGEWTSRGKAFAEALFDCQLPESSLISYDA